MPDPQQSISAFGHIGLLNVQPLFSENIMSQASIFLSVLTPHEFTALVRANRPWFRPPTAAAYIHYSVRTLESWRAGGTGPAYKGKGKSIRYHIDALDAFINADPSDDATPG